MRSLSLFDSFLFASRVAFFGTIPNFPIDRRFPAAKSEESPEPSGPFRSVLRNFRVFGIDFVDFLERLENGEFGIFDREFL